MPTIVTSEFRENWMKNKDLFLLVAALRFLHVWKFCAPARPVQSLLDGPIQVFLQSIHDQ